MNQQHIDFVNADIRRRVADAEARRLAAVARAGRRSSRVRAHFPVRTSHPFA